MPAQKRMPTSKKAAGGLSGPAVHPIAVRLVHEVRRRLDEVAPGTPIVGLGGVTTWKDAAEFVLVGADAVGIGTGLFVDPRSPRRLLRGLERWVRQQGTDSISALKGGFES